MAKTKEAEKPQVRGVAVPQATIVEMMLGTQSGDVAKMMQAILDNKATQGVEVVQKGKQLILPDGMTTAQAIDFLARRQADEERDVVVEEVIVAFPLDAAYALSLVLKEQFNISGSESTTQQGLFGSYKVAPKYVSVEISRGKRVQVPWGDFQLPGIEGTISAGFAMQDNNRVVFKLIGKVQGKFRESVTDIANLVREKLKTHSIYRGQAIKVCFRDDDDEPIFFHPGMAPEFMNLETRDQPIFTETTEAQLQMTVWNPLIHTERLREIGLSRKRTVLLEGGFGTGKTLAALKTAQIATKSGWTYIYCTHAEDLKQAVELALQYAPSVVFAEDIDRVASGDRDKSLDDLSYVMDGVDNKEREVMIVVTTNDAERISHLMLRAGRIDNIVSIESPDATVVWKLLNSYARGRLRGTEEQFQAAIAPMVGQNAAFIAEVVKQAQLRSIGRDEPEVTIEPDDVLFSVRMMKRHLELMSGVKKPTSTKVPLSELEVVVEHRNGDSPTA